ncbi:helix-turn-helix domain-containing protein [Curtobacterium sp. C1]|uniref:helix-turn-helix domain-containing protein n=1 Tax=Curtobacterium sp. C1 TaxID=2898151 RepID=UPI001E303CD7|nr:helix-turn-helix transcriptional regulator [Curtobacterium sp. C1]UFU14592.1 helix-turn-helix domain-containing protein [Curtobacterium sp. C1]
MGTRELNATIVANIRTGIDRFDLSPRALADLTSIPSGHIIAFFDGREEMTLDELSQIAGALGVHPADFLIGAS